MSNSFLEILESFRHTRADAYHMLQSRTSRHGFDNMISNHILSCTNNHLDIGSIATVNDILLGQQVSSRNSHRSQFMQSDDTEPELNTTFQYEHDHIAMADTQTLEIRSRSIGFFLQFGKRILMFHSLVIGPKNGFLVGLFGCPSIYHIVAEVKVYRNLYFEVLSKILLRGIFRLFYKSFQHNTFSSFLHDNRQELHSLTIQSLHTMRLG